MQAMLNFYITIRCAISMVAVLLVSAGAFAGPPAPVPYKAIPDLPDNAERHIVVKAQDRGPVWLLTGFLNIGPCVDFNELASKLAALKTMHWRTDAWPFWSSSKIIATPREEWGDYRDSAADVGKMLDTIIRLKKNGMTYQIVLHHKGSYYGKYHIGKDELKTYYDHIYTLVKYCVEMGVPIDYWEIWNEPQVGPYEGLAKPGFWHGGTWQEYLDMWDTSYTAIRAADPNAKIVGPSYGTPEAATTPTKMFTPFLEHCKKKGQRLDVLSLHFPEGAFTGKLDPQPDLARKAIEEVRNLVQSKYHMLGVKEYHIDEWGSTIDMTGPGTQIAYFYYLDLAGIDRAAKALWTVDDLGGILVNPKIPRTSYWAWKEYAAGDGVRLITNTNDRCVVAIASRDDKTKTVRALVARSKRYSGAELSRKLPPVKTTVDFEGLPISGDSEVTILHLGPGDGPVWGEDLPKLTTWKLMNVDGGKLTMMLNRVAENDVYSIRIAPIGTRASEEAAKLKLESDRKTARDVAAGIPLPKVLFTEGFETGFTAGQTVLGKNGWVHQKNAASTTVARSNRVIAHSGSWYAEFSDDYWSTHDVFHPLPEAQGAVLETTTWFRFSDYEGNTDGKGRAGMMIGLFETPDRDADRNVLTFFFGTNEQNSYARFRLTDKVYRGLRYMSPSGIRDDVRGKWCQIGIVLDHNLKTVTARYRFSAKKPWKVFYSGQYTEMSWAPKYVYVDGYNQSPDWRLDIDDVEVRSNVP